MASSSSMSMSAAALLLFLFTTTTLLSSPTSANHAPTRKLALVQTPALILTNHKGPLLTGHYAVNLIWYGKFTSTQRSIITDFIQSLSPPPQHHRPPHHTSTNSPPSVAEWWNITNGYMTSPSPPSTLTLGKQYIDNHYTFGKLLTQKQILKLTSKLPHRNAINILLTSPDVVPTPRFCVSACGTHSTGLAGKHHKMKYVYGWVGDSATQCPGQCGWPFHQPMFGPQTPPLIAPNGEVGVDGMVINLATILAGVVTDPYGNGYFQGEEESAGLEAVSACAGIFGSGAFPGEAGKVLIDDVSGASFNAVGVYGRKFLLPAMWDPKTKTCKTLV